MRIQKVQSISFAALIYSVLIIAQHHRCVSRNTVESVVKCQCISLHRCISRGHFPPAVNFMLARPHIALEVEVSCSLFFSYERSQYTHSHTHTKRFLLSCSLPSKVFECSKTTFQKKNQRTVICLAFSPILITHFPRTSIANKVSPILQHQQA